MSVNKKSGKWVFDWSYSEVVMGEVDGVSIECTVRDCVCPEVSMTDINGILYSQDFKTEYLVNYINNLIRDSYESGYKDGYDRGYTDNERSR